jgi:hypothetical protein
MNTAFEILKRFVISLSLFLVAIWITWIIAPISFFIALFDGLFKVKVTEWILRFSLYLFTLAYSIDQFGNVLCKSLFNKVLIKEETIYCYNIDINVDMKFGNPEETISSVLGRSKAKDNLTFIGRMIADLLNWIDEDHVEKAVEN